MNLTARHKSIVKWCFAIVLIGFITYKISSDEMLTNFNAVRFLDTALWALPLAVLLMPVNWLLEAKKWHLLMSRLQGISVKQAMAAVLAGLSTGLLTPNRIGNFIGRMAHLDAALRPKAILLTFLANMAQFSATIFFGLIGLSYWGVKAFELNAFYIYSISGFGLLLAIWAYYRPAFFMRPFRRFLPVSMRDSFDFAAQLPDRLKTGVLLLAYLRYLVFLSQYFLILLAFFIPHNPGVLLGALSVVYLVMTLTPSLFFGKLFIREAAALLILPALGVSTPVVLISGFLLWLVNIALPALVGLRILVKGK